MKFLEWWSNQTSDMAIAVGALLLVAMLIGLGVVGVVAHYTLAIVKLLTEITP